MKNDTEIFYNLPSTNIFKNIKFYSEIKLLQESLIIRKRSCVYIMIYIKITQNFKDLKNPKF